MRQYVWLLLLFYCYSNSIFVFSENADSFLDRFHFSYLTMEQGLPNNNVSDIVKDELGFLWIATEGAGLSRYDGYSLNQFNANGNSAQTSIKSNFVKRIATDRFSRLWIGSEGGLDLFDLKSNRVISFSGWIEDQFSFINKHISNLLVDSKDNVWVQTENSLFYLILDEEGMIKKINNIIYNNKNIISGTLIDIEENGNIWFSINNRLYQIRLKENSYYITEILSDLEFSLESTINSLIKKDNEVWIATFNGLFRYDLNTQDLKGYVYNNEDFNSISQNLITDLVVNQNNQLIASTLKGINIYNPLADGFERVNYNSASLSKTGLNSNFVNCLFIDGNRLWVGTATGGVNKIAPKALSIQQFKHNPKDRSSLSPNPVNSIFMDNNKNLWVGTVEGGLNYLKKDHKTFIHYTLENSGLSHNSVSSIISDNKGHLWVGTWGGGITLFDIKSHQVVSKLSAQSTGKLLDFIGVMCLDTINNGIWIGANQGLFFYDLNTDKLFSPLEDEQKGINGYVGAIIDAENKLWLGGLTGIYVIDLNTYSISDDQSLEYTHYIYKLDKPASKVLEKGTCFFQAPDGALWIGSNGHGIYKRNINAMGEEVFIPYTTFDGLPNNNIKSILGDENGNLWIATNNGLSFYDASSNSFCNYTTKDGLISNEFYWGAALMVESQIYLGALNGLMIIKDDDFHLVDDSNSVRLTRLLINNNEVFSRSRYIDNDIAYSDKIRMHERDKSISIEFSSLCYRPTNRSFYSYRLLGFDNKWITVAADRRTASYTNLHSGKYTFQVRCVGNELNGDSSVTEVEIIVSPYFYKTYWFYFLVLFSIFFVVWSIYKHRTLKLKEQQQKLHQKVEDRTSELKTQTERLETQTRELSLQNKILKHQNEKINRQKNQLLKMSKKIQDLTSDKIDFFTNITHEFRTPITLISGPIERALKLSSNNEVIEQLLFVKRNSTYLLSLVNQIMDFRKVESEDFRIEKRMSNYPQLVNSVVASFEGYLSKKEICLRNLVCLSSPCFLFDEKELRKVFINLLSNAIKFTPKGGRITLYSTILSICDEQKLFFSINDSGPGIREEDINMIFNRFYQSKNKKTNEQWQMGTGIGLFLCKRIIEKHQGAIVALNKKPQGSCFRFFIPFTTINDTTLRENIKKERNTNELIISEVEYERIDDQLSVLVVEDNADMKSYVCSVLKDKYNVFSAINGREALTLLKQEDIDFIISDLMMPVMGGVELLKEVKYQFEYSHIPFLMLTAKSSDQSKLDSYKIGVEEYLLKPFDEEMLLARIDNILQNKKRYHKRFIYDMNLDELPIEEESEDKLFLTEVMNVIKENYKNSYFDVGDFTDALRVSRSLLNKKLQSIIGQSPGQFIRNYRLNVARDLILQNKETRNLNISEIAYEVGFNDPKYFSRCFSKYFKVTPSSLMD